MATIGVPAAACKAAPFKEAISRWATGVASASCRFEGAPHKVAISSFTTVSATPPRMLFCFAKTSRSALASPPRTGRRDRSPARSRGAPGAKVFRRDRPARSLRAAVWDLDLRAPPRLHAALAHFKGCFRSRLDAGSHEVPVIDLQDVGLGQGAPLLYSRGS